MDTCIHTLFEMQSERTPHAIALDFAGKRLTYQELNWRANQLAHHLHEQGIGPEILVGLCLERSLEMIVAILAILKAGGAFVPLDPGYPRERLGFMLHDAQVALLITQQSLAEQFKEDAIQTLSLDSQQHVIAQYKTHNLANVAYPENLAYVIYTSGSTGKPKGVMVRHRGLCNLAFAQKQAFELREDSHILQFASLSFDASVWEIFMALLAGATLHLATKDSLLPGPSLIEVLQERNITVATLPPSALAILPDVELPALQTLITAGEACPASLVARWAPNRYFFNAYGPTETTVCATMARCHDSQGNPSIGLPIANMQVHILDEKLRQVPVGDIGEIYVGGIGLARGYLRRPELTAERFIPDPFGDEAGERLYKTGDLARYLPDGQIEFLGRSDSQVKIRGYRIELGEIEAMLNAHPVVREAVVIAREDRPGERRLVAYFIAKQEQNIDLRGLRSNLGASLPDYMLPSAFVVLKEWPLTPNGKIDRRSLPMPDAGSLALREPFVAPRTPYEEALAQVWREMLHLDHVGMHDNFFLLGGHSLLATQIAARIRNTFQVEMAPATVFTCATIAELAHYIEQQRYGEQDQRIASIQLLPRRGNLPLSFSQERVWFLQQLDPTNLAYNAQAILRLTGRLDVETLERSLSEIVRRHEIFRTTFPAVDGRPVQLIHQPQAIKIPLVDLRTLAEHEHEAAVQRLMHKEFQQPFDITQLPLARWSLLRLSEQEYILVHVEHHLVHDGWSFTVFLRELQELYTAFVTGRPSSLPPLAIQFADFAQWQRQWMQGKEAEAQLAYWKQKLAGSPALLELPTDYPRPAVLGFKGAVQRIDLPVALCEALRVRCRQEGVTLYMMLLAAFLTLLYRYSGQEDLCVGAGIANRRWQETEPLIGMIINTLALRTDLSGNPTFQELLGRVREVTLEAYAHQDLPFGKVVEALQPERSLSYSPLYQTLFSFHDSPLPDLNLPELKVKITEGLSNNSAKFDINIVVIPRAEQLVGMQTATEDKAITLIWEYNTDLFVPATIQRMTGHYQELLRQISVDPGQRINAMSMLTQAEQQQLLFSWNETTADYPQGQCIHQLFEAQVERTPDDLAVSHGRDRLTYSELNRRANQLAHYLQQRGAGPEVFIGICVERSLDLIVGLLGILKAGAAYVPLDPNYPRERLMFMLEDARIPLLLTQERLLHHLPDHDAQVICLDTDWQQIGLENENNPRSNVISENVAYVIYTSGSTGRPKGVQIPHQAVVNFLTSMRQQPGLQRHDVMLAVTSISFDIAALELFLPLVVGAREVIASREDALDVTRLMEQLATTQATVMQATPATWLLLLAAGWQGDPRLTILCGGEALNNELAMQLLGKAGRLWNMYGPTETTIWSTLHQIETSDRSSYIGCPIANTQIYILDQSWQPVPIGVPGALYIGGDGLARGYLNSPDLTAERFVPHPFSCKPGARLYKTGDLARYRPDGKLEFLGRLDHQVKLRGFRIELGEIETLLNQHPAVQECVAVVREDAPGDRRLVAYMVLRSDQAFTTGTARSLLQQRLPEYMIPAHFVPLEQLPLTPNGKVDRRALPPPDEAMALSLGEFIAPRNAVEEEIAAIWRELLHLPKVGIHDNFFTLGGHSLLATQMISRLSSTFQVELPLRSFFGAATIAGLAVAIVERQASEIDEEQLTQLLAELEQTV
ncbi:MAG TPA: amino acid adenylation domain-containing protein [Ktedonobacteraceae bacterium]|nr:amino acid adenylation domain-containing protein [Ktedonobacteraceae bacterium]